MDRPNYHSFSIKKLNTPEFRHIWLLLYWIIFGLVFWPMERILPMHFHNVHCMLDDIIPFCEYFIIPYYFWFVFLIGMMIYGFFFDISAFKNYMKFTIITYTITLVIYAVYPTSQALRPTEFARNNIFTEIVKFMYGFDTNTNVCPSIHVLGSLAVYFSARKSRVFSSIKWRIIFLFFTILIIISTVFLKQHSVIDILMAIVISIFAYPFVYKRKKLDNLKEKSLL